MDDASIEDIALVDLEPEGVFKYILIKVSLKGASKVILRGYNEEYHGVCRVCAWL